MVLLLRRHEVIDGEGVVEGVVVLRLQVRLVRQDRVMLGHEVLALRHRGGGGVLRAQRLARLHVRQGPLVLAGGGVGVRGLVAVAALGAGGAAVPSLATRVLRGDLLVALEALLPPQVAAVLKHVPGVRVQSPKGALPRFIRRPGHFEETVIEGQRVADGVLPALLVLSVKREQVHYPLVDLGQCQHLTGRLLDGHGDEGDVGVRRFGVRVAPAVGLRVSGPVDVRLSVNGAHGVHGVVGCQGVHGRGLRRHGAHAGAQGCAHGGHARWAHAVHAPGARRHAGHGGAHARVDVRHVHGVGRHVGTGAHARHAHVGVHGVHPQAGVHVANRGVTLPVRGKKQSSVSSGTGK